MTANSALNQNWVGCTVRTPRTQVARTLRAQCPCRGRCCAHSRLVALMSRAQPAQVARMLGVHLSRHAQAACPKPGRDIVPGRDLLEASPMSRHHSGQSRSRLPGGVATPVLCPHRCPCRDIKMMSRHQAWPNHCHPCRDLAMMSRHQACSAAATHVATSNSCRDTAFS